MWLSGPSISVEVTLALPEVPVDEHRRTTPTERRATKTEDTEGELDLPTVIVWYTDSTQ